GCRESFRPPGPRQENHSRQGPFCAAGPDRRGDGGVGLERKNSAPGHRVRSVMKGTTPAGARTEGGTGRVVRGMFGRVASRYDLANHLLSLNIDKWWRAHTVHRVRPILAKPDARVLDICCGTGDLVLALERRAAGPVIGSDFCHPMLVAARDKIAQGNSRASLFEADALRLPLATASFDLITVAFGFRNLANYEKGLREMRRVLRPGGTVAILEF